MPRRLFHTFWDQLALFIRRHAWSSGPLLAASALIALCWVGVNDAIRAHRQEAESAAAADLGNQALALAGQVGSELMAGEETQQILSAAWRNDPAAFDVATWSQRLVLLRNGTLQAVLANPHGQILGSSRPGLIGSDVSASDWFRDTAAPAGSSGRMFIVAPTDGLTTRDGQAVFADRLTEPGSQPAGVIATGCDLAVLAQGFDQLDLGAGGLVMLVDRQNGTILAASGHGVSAGTRPPRDAAADTRIVGSALFAALAQTPAGDWQGLSSVDGIERYHAFHAVPGSDLAVVVGFSRADALRPTWEWARGARGFAAGTTLLIIGLTVLVLGAERAARLRQAALRNERMGLANKTAQLEATFAGMSDGIMMVDGSLRLLGWNEHFVDFTGVPREALRVGLPMADIVRAQAEVGEFGPVDVDAEVARRIGLLRSGAGLGTIERVRPNGRVMELRRSPLPDGGFVTLYTDITARRQVEDRLRESEKLAAIGRLTSGIAHDFNNLLTSISGNADMLGRHPDDMAANPRRLAIIQQAVTRGAELVQQLLTFARKRGLTPVPVDLNARMQGMCNLLRSTLDPSINIETKLEPALWPALADPGQVEQVVLNLAINARDAMKEGGVLTLITSNVRVDETAPVADLPFGDYVLLAVADTGIGMTPDVQRNAFEPFFTTKDVGEGSGLGLSQVYGIARQSGGAVQIESSPGRGTTVRVLLPRSGSPASDAVIPAAEPPVRRGSRPTAALVTAMAGRTTVLLVEDQADVRETLSAILAEHGLLAIAAESGQHALRMIGDGLAFDLLLADFAMPGMNGAELAMLVRQKRPLMPVVFITGYQDDTPISQERWVLTKPFDAEALLSVLAEALAAQQSAEPA